MILQKIYGLKEDYNKNKTRTMKNVRTFNEFINENQNVNEGTYDDFISMHGSEAKKLIDKLIKLRSKVKKWDEKQIDRFFNSIEMTYDEPVINMIDGILLGNEKPTLRDLGELAVTISNRFGTEGSAIVMALEDAVNNIR